MPGRVVPLESWADASLLYRVVQTAAVVLALFGVILVVHVATFGYLAFAFAGASLIQFSLGVNRRELAASAGIGAAYGLAYGLSGGAFAEYCGWLPAVVGGFAGIGSVALAACKWIWAEGAARPAAIRSLRAIALIPILCTASVVVVFIATALTPNTYDYSLYRADALFGFQPSFVTGRWFRANPWIWYGCGLVYNALPFWLSALCAMEIRWPKRAMGNTPLALMALGGVGFVLYQICPAAGPLYRFGPMFPGTPPDPLGVQTASAFLASFPRNAMPSLHVGWTLVLFWSLARWGWAIRAAAAIIVLCTLLAILGSGEHYLVDAVVAAPLACAVIAGCSRYWAKAILGASLSVLWLVCLRLGLVTCWPAMVFQTAAAITVAVSFLIPAWFSRA
jgi:PAP2 superfamily